MRITRLGQGVDATARARARRDRAHRRGAARVPRRRSTSSASTDVRATATSAARDATNRDEFFDRRARRARRRARAALRRRRGALSFLGATADLDEPAPYLVVDVGGGSTEFVARHRRARRLDLDRHRLRAAHRAVPALRPARARGAERTRSRSCATTSPTSTARFPACAEAATLVGLAGTVTHARRDRARACPTTTASGSTTSGSRGGGRRRVPHARDRAGRAAAHNPGLEPGPRRRHRRRRDRGRLRHAALGFDEMLVSEADILDGLARTAPKGP